MQQLKARDFRSKKTSCSTHMTISCTGVISISPSAVALLNVSSGDRVIITKDKDGDYFTGKCKISNDPDGFQLREYNKSNSLQFNAKGLVTEIVSSKDLAVHPDKKKSVRLEINGTDPTKWEGIDLYQIVTD